MGKPKNWAFYLRGYAGLAIFIPAFGVVLFSRPLVRQGMWLDLALDAAAWAILWCGILMRLWAILYVGGRKGKSLVTDGPYACCRNPLYFGSFMIGLSLATFAKSVIVLAAFMVLFMFYLLLVIRSEEVQLSAAFSEEWQAYASTVPRLLPRWRWKTAPKIEVDPRSFTLEALRMTGAAMIPLLAECIAKLRVSPWWPRFWTLP